MSQKETLLRCKKIAFLGVHIKLTTKRDEARSCSILHNWWDRPLMGHYELICYSTSASFSATTVVRGALLISACAIQMSCGFREVSIAPSLRALAVSESTCNFFRWDDERQVARDYWFALYKNLPSAMRELFYCELCSCIFPSFFTTITSDFNISWIFRNNKK